MSVRGFGFQTLSGSAQPAFGTTITAPVYINPDLQTGRIDVASQPSQAVLSLSANLFRVGDRILIGPTSAFGQVSAPTTTPPDGGVISAVNTAANTATVNGLQKRHNASEWAVLAIPCGQAVVQNGNALLNLGEDDTVSATSTTLVAQIQAQGIYVLGNPALGNCVESQRVWLQGTNGQQFLPSLLTI